MKRLSQFLGIFFFFPMGILQMWALFSGLTVGWDLHWLIALILTLFLGGFPIIGAIIAMPGAVYGWHWSWTRALLVFGLPYAIILAGAYIFILIYKESGKNEKGVL